MFQDLKPELSYLCGTKKPNKKLSLKWSWVAVPLNGYKEKTQVFFGETHFKVRLHRISAQNIEGTWPQKQKLLHTEVSLHMRIRKKQQITKSYLHVWLTEILEMENKINTTKCLQYWNERKKKDYKIWPARTEGKT